MFTAFQPNAYQNNAYQIGGNGTGLLGGGPSDYEYSHQLPYQRYAKEEFRRKELAERKAELGRIEEELALKEREAQEASDNLVKAREIKRQNKEARRLALLEAVLQVEIDRLRLERIMLMRWIDDEEAILVILLSSIF